MTATFRICVLGCKVNRYEAEQIRGALERRGWRAAEADEPADLTVLHSCVVTAAAAGKTRQHIRRLLKASPGSVLLLTGCGAAHNLVPLDPPHINIPPGPGWLDRLERALDALPLSRGAGHPASDADESDRVIDDWMPIEDFGDRHRAFLKVQDGCDICCSYCIVPSLRGAPRDKPIDLAVSEARGLVARGYREIVVTGVCVGAYGRDSGAGLDRLLSALLQVDGLDRLRMSSLHPAELTDALLKVWSADERILPHVHLPLQSGSDRILAAMRRGYTCADYLEAIERVRSALDRPSFTTDVIVGFPGETDEDFEETLAVCDAAVFSRLHIFPYSPRPGTAAAQCGALVPVDRVRERIRRLKSKGAETLERYARGLVGREDSVLIEQIRDDVAEGYSSRYLPTAIARDSLPANAIATVRNIGWADGKMDACRSAEE